MKHDCKLTFDIRSFWHIGTGRGQGVHLDAITRRDARGLPLLPGRSVKGLVRDAVHHAETLGWYPEHYDITAELFGVRGEDGAETRPATLRFSDATLPADVADYLADRADLREQLFRPLFSTAIDHDSGTARESSLRGMEAVIPLELTATVQPLADCSRLGYDWCEVIRRALPLIRGIGADRSRGLGRAIVTLKETSAC
jgi:CRISPR/Cas system CSM-associated protein Csm3 (group 7 of RAMP superfamily)